jgi:hypothetical protein
VGLNTKSSVMDWVSNIRLGCNLLTVTNNLTYYGRKSLIIEAPAMQKQRYWFFSFWLEKRDIKCYHGGFERDRDGV